MKIISFFEIRQKWANFFQQQFFFQSFNFLPNNYKNLHKFLHIIKEKSLHRPNPLMNFFHSAYALYLGFCVCVSWINEEMKNDEASFVTRREWKFIPFQKILFCHPRIIFQLMRSMAAHKNCAIKGHIKNDFMILVCIYIANRIGKKAKTKLAPI